MFAQGGQLRRDGLMVHDLFLMQVKQPAESKSEWDLLKVLETLPGADVFPALTEEHSCKLLQ